MSRERISATVDPGVKEQLDQQDVNASGLVNKLLKQYFSTGGDSEKMLELRKEQIKSDIEQHKSSISTLENELETVEARLEMVKEERELTREEYWSAAEEAVTIRDGQIIDGEKYLTHHASNLGITVEELRQGLVDRYNE